MPDQPAAPDTPVVETTMYTQVSRMLQTTMDERDQLLALLLHVNVLPHHSRPFKAGNIDFAGCPSCAKIRDVWFQHGRLHSDRDPEQQAAFVPPEDAEDAEDLSDAAHNSPAE